MVIIGEFLKIFVTRFYFKTNFFTSLQIKYDETTGKQSLIIPCSEMGDAGEYMAKAKDCKTSCKVVVKEGEKKPELNPSETEFQGNVGQPLTIEIPYKSKSSKP